MSAEEVKAICRRICQEWHNEGSSGVLDEHYASDLVLHRPPYPDIEGLEGFKQWGTDFRNAFPDAAFTIDEIIVEGETVVARLTYRGTNTGPMGPDFPPTGKWVSGSGCIVWHWEGGKVVEEWDFWDELGFWQQIGCQLIPPQEPARQVGRQ